MSDAAPTNDAPSDPNVPKRRGKVRKTAHDRQGAPRERPRPGDRDRSLGRLPLPPPQRQPQRRRRHRPADRPSRQGRGQRPAGAAQRPGDGVGQPRLRRLQHRQPHRWRSALRHHDPPPPLGGPRACLRHQHPARPDRRPSRLQGRGRQDDPRRHPRDVERGVLGRRSGLHHPAGRAAHRHPPRPLRRGRLRGLPRDGRRDRWRPGLHPRADRRPGPRHQHRGRQPQDQGLRGAQLRA